MTSYRQHQTITAPPWLQDERAQSLLYVFGLIKDAYIEATKRALKLRFTDTAPGDALDAIAGNYDLERGFITDDVQFRAMLKQAWAIWDKAGTEESILAALATLNITNVAVMENKEWNAQGTPSHWWKFWLVIKTPHPVVSGDDAPTATTLGANLVRSLPGVIDKWKPANEYAYVVIVISGKLWADPIDPWTWGDGTTWGGESVRFDFG